MSQLISQFFNHAPAAKKLIIVMLGGGLGAASRYTVGLLAPRLLGTGFPWGTLIVNLGGCFLIGLFFGLSNRLWFFGPDLRLFLITGYLGALTTFSTYSLESVNASLSGLGWQALLNIVVNTVAGLCLTLLGLYLAGLGGHR